MSKRARVETIFLYGVILLYILFMLKLLLLSRISVSELFSGSRVADRSTNFIPFQSITAFLSGSTANAKRFAFSNVVGNVAAFVPFGAYLLFVGRDKRVRTNLLIVLLASVCVELTQWIFGIGTLDIDDVILNTLGGLIGICGYKLFMALLRDESKVRTLLAVCSAIGLPVLLFLLFGINLRL